YCCGRCDRPAHQRSAAGTSVPNAVVSFRSTGSDRLLRMADGPVASEDLDSFCGLVGYWFGNLFRLQLLAVETTDTDDEVMSTPTTSTSPATESQQFVRGLGLLDSTMMVAGSMIGSGIFIVSSIIARQVGAPGWLLVVWIVTGLLTLTAALSYGELAAMM